MPAALFISCAEAARRISRKEDDQLSRAAQIGLLLHLATCRFCRRFKRQARVLHSVLHSFHDHIDEVSVEGLSAEAKERIIVRMRHGS